MIYFVLNNYTPNTASTNRIIGYLEVFEQKGIPVTVCFVLPGLHDETVSKKYDNIRFRYMWKGFPHKSKISKALIFLWSLYKIRKIIRHGDIVYTYNINAIIKYLIGKKNIYYFAERTEHLDVTAKEPWPLGLSRKKCIETCKRLDGLFVISSQLKKYFVDNGLDAWKVHVINMTVDSNRFSNIEKNKTTERYIAYCGTASNNKDGVDELIKAFSIVANSIDDIKLYIIGKIPTKEDKVNNLALIENLNLKEKIVLTGVVSSNKMPQMLKNAEALVLDRPNSLQAQYGFPTKLGEYLLTGNPVVVTKVGDIPLYLKDGVSALLSEDRNPKEFAEKIIWSLTHPEEAAIIGQNGQRVALQYFNNDTETSKIISIFQTSRNSHV